MSEPTNYIQAAEDSVQVPRSPAAARKTAEAVFQYLADCDAAERWPTLDSLLPIFSNNFAPIMDAVRLKAEIAGLETSLKFARNDAKMVDAAFKQQCKLMAAVRAALPEDDPCNLPLTEVSVAQAVARVWQERCEYFEELAKARLELLDIKRKYPFGSIMHCSHFRLVDRVETGEGGSQRLRRRCLDCNAVF